MTFDEVLDHVRTLLRHRGRLSYGALKRRFDLDEAYLQDLKDELIEAEQVAQDENGTVLVWTAARAPTVSEERSSQPVAALAVAPPSSPPPPVQPDRTEPVGERRQLTVMFCDLVGSTALSEQLDPEEFQTVVRTYQEVSAQVIERYDGYIAQYLGDGLLVYFGYPVAHEDDAARSIRTGLEIVSALDQARSQFPQPVQVRIGIHTGPVVVGQMGGGSRHEQLALGETPNIAARVQGQAQPDQVVISAATQRLVAGLFETDDRGLHELKGISTPQSLYRVTAETGIQSRFEVAVRAGLTPLVGREDELGVLYERWTQAQAGEGQAVLVSGEPGIGKSRLMQELRERVVSEGAISITFQCSAYHQNSALYPITAHLQRLLQLTPDDTPETKRAKLQLLLGNYRFPQTDTLPLLAALLSFPHLEGVPSLTMSPQKRKQLTQAALVAWLIEETEQQAVYNVWEDLHWADPSTLEVLELLLSQVPTTQLFAVLTFRPEFVPPWSSHSYVSQLTLNRLGQPQVNAMVKQVTGGKALPEEVVEQIMTKTDGVPLFVEELTKMVMESGLVQTVNNHYELTGPVSALSIPATLHDSLMARLDRLATAKEVAQLGATIGREFSYELLQAVSVLGEARLQQGLQQLVDAELVYQRGLPPQARYTFKHALVQDTAYQSLLKRTRHQYHHQIAQVLKEQFLEIVDAQPELVAHHYTEAGFIEQAIGYWQQAGQCAVERSANSEAVSHLTTGLELFKTLPDISQRAEQELLLQLPLGTAYLMTKGYGVPEVGQTYNRARELCQQQGDIPRLIPALLGLSRFYGAKADYHTARPLGEQLLRIARQNDDTATLVVGHYVVGLNLWFLGQQVEALAHFEQGLGCYKPQQDSPAAFRSGVDPWVGCHAYAAIMLWLLGYPDQAQTRCQEALSLAQESTYPSTQAIAFMNSAMLGVYSREAPRVQTWAEQGIALSQAHGIAFYLATCTMMRGWALVEQGDSEEGLHALLQGVEALRAQGTQIGWTWNQAMLAQAYATQKQSTKGITAVAEGLAAVDRNDERYWEAELYRLKGELLLNDERGMMNDERKSRKARVLLHAGEAEDCFQKAIEVARRQEAKSWELRVATSLARLWQQQGKTTEARDLLVPIYGWFTEGFDTADLTDAKALLAALAEDM